MSENVAVSGKLRGGVAEEIRVLLARRRMSPTELGRRLGWSQSYISRRMVGDLPFDVDDLEQIAEVLGVKIVELLPRAERVLTGGYPRTGDKPNEAVKIPPQRNPHGKSRPAGRSDSRHPAGRPERRTSPTRL